MIIKVLRGIPGSGKSTWIQKTFPRNLGMIVDRPVDGTDVSVHVCSADAFFTGADGVYRFDASKLAEAHNACLSDYVVHVFRDDGEENTDDIVIVDNTNISVAECAPYMALGMAYGHDVELITFDLSDCSYQSNASTYEIDRKTRAIVARSRHGVPIDQAIALHSSLHAANRTIPLWWRSRTIPVQL